MSEIKYGIGNEDAEPLDTLEWALTYYPEFHGVAGAFVERFAITDVARITHHFGSWPEGWDGDFAGVGELKDGRWFGWEGWHDSTGWDCRSSAVFVVVGSQADAIRFGLGEASRELFGEGLDE